MGFYSLRTQLWSVRSGQKNVGALSVWSFPFSGLTHRHRLANKHPHTQLLLLVPFLSRLPACSASLIKMHWCDCLKVQYVQNAGQMNAACVWVLCMFIWVWKSTGSRGVTVDIVWVFSRYWQQPGKSVMTWTAVEITVRAEQTTTYENTSLNSEDKLKPSLLPFLVKQTLILWCKRGWFCTHRASSEQ